MAYATKTTFLVKDAVCKFGKQSKERMTVFVAANMTGNNKLPLLIIGKSENPRQIKTVRNLDFQYYFNQTAWMTEIIFFDYFQKLNVKMIKEKQSIVMFIDNCRAHPVNLSFSNVKIIFLPENTTSVLQPMDAGIIKCFKGYYRTRAARFLIKWNEQNQFGDKLKQNAIQFYQAIEMAVSSWGDVTSKTISNCFRHCGFYRSKCSIEVIDNEYDEFKLIDEQFKRVVKEESVDLETFVAIDNNLSVSGLLNEIILPEPEVEQVDINGDFDSAQENEVPIIHLKTINANLEYMRLYALQRKDKKTCNDLLKLVNDMENVIFNEPRSFTQISIDNYLKD